MNPTEPHSLARAFEDFIQKHSPEVVYPIFRLLHRVVLAFPVLESREAVDGFVWLVGKIQTETVVAEQQNAASRTKNPKRLQTPLLRAVRHLREYYFVDVREHPNDSVMARIPRWASEAKTLPVYLGKLDVPHPTVLRWDYDLLLCLCDFVNKEVGLSHWRELATKLPQEDPQRLALPVAWWPKGEYFEPNIPDDATPSEAAFLILSAKTKLSPEHLRKLIQEGPRLLPERIEKKLQRRWEKAFIDPKLGIIRVPLEDEKDDLIFDLREAEDLNYGFSIE